ncbi:MAG: response regulator [Spirochaetia bacterium]|nr:response regulator [Spirochaetia bacterium]
MKKKILIVEDEVIIAMELEMRLIQMGYAVPAILQRGDTAIQKIPELHPDLILMDINILGPLNGIETAASIKEKFSIPVIYLTANNDSETVRRAMDTDPFGILVKPFNESELKKMIESAFHGSAVSDKSTQSIENGISSEN